MSHTIKPYPWYRKLVHDATRLGMEKPYIQALGEADITTVRNNLKAHNKTTNTSISLTSHLICCLTKTIQQYPEVQSYKSWNNKIYTFKTIDVLIPIEIVYNNEKVLIPYIIRDTQNKSCLEIQNELNIAAKKTNLPLDKNQILFLKLPWFIRKPIYKTLYKFPLLMKKQIGTISFSPLHMFLKYKLISVGIPSHTLGSYTGGVYKDNVNTKLPLTFQADHDIIDGAYLAKFYSAFVTELQTGKIG